MRGQLPVKFQTVNLYTVYGFQSHTLVLYNLPMTRVCNRWYETKRNRELIVAQLDTKYFNNKNADKNNQL